MAPRTPRGIDALIPPRLAQADVYYYSPADGVNFSRGLWRECTWVRVAVARVRVHQGQLTRLSTCPPQASFPGQSKCNHISPKHAFGWERAVQGLWIIWFLIQFVVAVLFTAAMPAALRIRDRTGQGERAINSIAKAAGALSLFNGFIGLVVMSVFVARTPDGGRGVAASNKSRHLHWSYGLFTAAWCLNVVMAPIGWAA